MKELNQLKTVYEEVALKLYKEVPVDIETFIRDDYFLGRSTDNGKLIYSCWIEALKEIFYDDTKTLIVFTGGIGVGKSTAGVIALTYIVYKIALLRNAWKTFNLAESSSMAVSFFNLTKTLSDSRAFAKMQAFMMKSEWFTKNSSAVIRGTKSPKIEIAPLSWVLSSPYCFPYDTEIALINNKKIKIGEVERLLKKGRKLYTYSVDYLTGDIRIGQIIRGGKTRCKAKIIRIYLENGETIDCTLDHKFLLSKGEYIEARNLKKGMDLWVCLYVSAKVYDEGYKGYRVKSTRVLKKRVDVYDIEVAKYHNFSLWNGVIVHNCQGFGTLGSDVVAGILDEIDSPTESPKQKARVIKAYENTFRRFESRFVIRGVSIGKLFLVASKQDEHSFIDVFVEKMKDSKRVKVFDIPLWEAKPKSYFSGVTFPVVVGDAYNPSKIITEEERIKYEKEGMRIIDIPIEFQSDFVLDVDASLRDIAGVTVAGNRKRKLIASEQFIRECMTEDTPIPKRETIYIGLKDDVRLIDYLDIGNFKYDLSFSRYIHIDMAISGDAMGIACSCISGWTDLTNLVEEDVTVLGLVKQSKRVPVVYTDFALRIKAKEGDRIPLHKVRELILDLKRVGLNIVKLSADLKLASEDMTQILEKAGVGTEYISVDRTEKPYLDYRNMIYEKRWATPYNEYLYFELKHLEYNPKGRPPIDHPEEVKDIVTREDGSIEEIVREGSKDVSDGVAGSIALLLKEEIGTIDTGLMTTMLQTLRGMAGEGEGNLIDTFNFRDKQGRKIKADNLPKTEAEKIKDLFSRLR